MSFYDILLAEKLSGGGGGVTPTGTINITQNGQTDVTNYATANVNVPQPSGKITITQNGTDIDVAQYATADVNVSGGGGSSYSLIASKEFEVSTTGSGSVGEIALDPEDWTSDKMLYINIYDKAGARDGYFYGSLTFVTRHMVSGTFGNLARNGFKYANGGFSNFTTNKGVYVDQVYVTNSSIKVYISANYQSTTSAKIDGTFACEVYALSYPSGKEPPFPSA